MLSVLLSLDDLGLGFLSSWIKFFVVSIASAQLSVLVTYINLPLITGYMLFGLIAGPQVCELIDVTDLKNLQYITQFALAFICLSAGAELYLPELKALFKRILIITGLLTVITFVLVLIVVYLESIGGLASYTSSLPAEITSPGGCQFSIALIAAAIMVSQSPASAIAVVRELGAKGPFTSTMLGVCVLIDVVVLLLASVSTSIANSECDPASAGFQILDLGLTLGTILLAVFVGWVLGKVIIFVIWLPRVPGEWLVPWLGFGVFQFSEWVLEVSTSHWGHGFNLDPLLICITGGYVVANQSRNRRKFLRFFNKAGPIIFIPFFTLTGAGLKLSVLLKSIPFALITALARAISFLVACMLGGYWSDMPAKQRNTLWMSMITQAGVSLGIAAEVALSFPAWGGDFQSVIIAVILINQILGPILCSRSIAMNGEVGQASGDDEDEEKIKRALFIGVNDDSLAIAQRLLNANWDVLFVDSSKEKLLLTQALHVPVREHHGHDDGHSDSGVHPAAAAASSADTRNHDATAESEGPHGATLQNDSEEQDFVSQVNSSSMIGHDEVELASPSAGTDADTDTHTEVKNETYVAVETQERVATRVIELPTLVQRSNRISDLLNTGSSNGDLMETGGNLARQHEALVSSYAAVLNDLNDSNTTAAIVMMSSDSQCWALCDFMLEKLHLTRVVAQINNPNWATMFASIGVMAIYSFSCTVSMIYNAVVYNGGKYELVNQKKPLHTQLAQLIKPEATETVPIHLTYSSEEDQRAFLAEHPNPPLATDKLWKFDEKFKVVNRAMRDEYLHSVYRVHASRLNLDTMKKLRRAGLTFSGPTMSGHADDDTNTDVSLTDNDTDTEDSVNEVPDHDYQADEQMDGSEDDDDDEHERKALGS